MTFGDGEIGCKLKRSIKVRKSLELYIEREREGENRHHLSH
jgi:hypothetical protein